jgi:hypothetical protein
MKVCYIYTYEDSVMKPTKYCLKRGRQKYNGGGELVQGTLYECMELS